MITLKTNFGNINIELDHKNAPKSAANFEQYVKEGFYDGTIFHRVISNFMVQGGGFTEDMEQKTTRDMVENEADNGLKNDCYTLAMARTGEPHSATAQFFINVKDNDFLNHTAKNTNGWGYCVFGKVISGQEVIDKIKAVETGSSGMYQDVPVETVVIEKATMADEA